MAYVDISNGCHGGNIVSFCDERNEIHQTLENETIGLNLVFVVSVVTLLSAGIPQYTQRDWLHFSHWENSPRPRISIISVSFFQGKTVTRDKIVKMMRHIDADLYSISQGNKSETKLPLLDNAEKVPNLDGKPKIPKLEHQAGARSRVRKSIIRRGAVSSQPGGIDKVLETAEDKNNAKVALSLSGTAKIRKTASKSKKAILEV